MVVAHPLRTQERRKLHASPVRMLVAGTRARTEPLAQLGLWVDDIESEAARLEALGARRVRDKRFTEHGLSWFQLADPEGNEFCVAHGM